MASKVTRPAAQWAKLGLETGALCMWWSRQNSVGACVWVCVCVCVSVCGCVLESMEMIPITY